MNIKTKALKWLIGIFTFFIVFFLLGTIFERNQRDKTMLEYPPIGQLYNHHGTNIHYIKEGIGEETIVLLSGNGTSSPYGDMYHLQKELSKHTETIIYERPGYGWSDNTSSNRTITNLAEELKAVLDAATVNERYIFVGHSMAALEIFFFAQKYPNNVLGIVLIDGVDPKYASEMKKSVPFSILTAKFLGDTGVLRLFSTFDQNGDHLVQNPYLPKEKDLHDMVLTITLTKMWNSTMIAERKELNHNGEMVNNGKKLGNIPLIIFSAEKNPMDRWKESQKNLVDWSTNAKQIWVDTDNHFIHYERPDLILEEINHLLNLPIGGEKS